jgi:endonuclease-8
MAEGHAVVRWARALAPLVAAPLLVVTLPRRWGERGAALRGERITGVETRGKHLLLHVSNGETLHCHAMQYGSWQVGAPGMALRKAPKYIRLRLQTAGCEAVFYHGPIVELLTAAELAQHPALNALGPDLMATDFDREEAARRVAAAGARPIGDVVIDQRVMAGIGNSYKSEGLFLAGIDPRRLAASVSRTALDRLWDVVIPLMWQGTERFGRTVTTPPAHEQAGHWNWVYRRRGHPCLVCGTLIQMVRQGDLQRTTYFCPRCQPAMAITAAVAQPEPISA